MATSGSWTQWTLNAGAGGSATFSGTWSTSISRPGTSNTATVTVTANVKSITGDYVNYALYVNGSKKKESTGYHAAGGTTKLTCTYTASVNDAAGTLTGKVYVKTYVGDYTKNSGTGNYSLSYGSKTTYTISYNANGGSGAPGNQTKYYGTNITLSSTKPSRTGYTFLRWNTASNGSGTNYNPGATYSTNANLSLYAVWQTNTQYTVTFNANGGTGQPGNQSCYAGQSLTLSSTKPTKASTSVTYTVTYDKVDEDAVISKNSDSCTRTTTYTFSKWNTKSDGTGTNYTSGQSITPSGNLTLYAVYASTTTGTVTLPTGTLDQATLAGWSTTEGGKTKVSDPYTPTADITLYAIWAGDGNGGMLRFETPPEFDETVFGVGTKVRLVGLADSENDGVYTIAIVRTKNLENTKRISLIFEEDFYISGTQDASQFELEVYGEGTYVPDMDFICEKDNRLWGCSSKTRTIYASALGDPTDFWTFSGDSLDAYQVAVGSAGNFTGAVTLNSQVIFLKQHTIHKMLGGYPAEYTLYTYNIDGTSETNGHSAINCNGTLIYVSEHGVATYTGANSGVLSKELGEGNMRDAIGAFNGEQYYLFYHTDTGETRAYIFDTRYGIWIQQDYGEVMAFAHLNDDDYVLIHNEDSNAVYQIDSGQPFDGDWQITFLPFLEIASGDWGSTSHIFEKKRYTGLTFRVELPRESWMKAELSADGGPWYPAARKKGRTNGVSEFQIITPRCDKLQLRLSGHGPMTILSMERQYTVGSRR